MFRRFFAGGFPGDVREGLNDGAVTQALPLAEDVFAQEVSGKDARATCLDPTMIIFSRTPLVQTRFCISDRRTGSEWCRKVAADFL